MNFRFLLILTLLISGLNWNQVQAASKSTRPELSRYNLLRDKVIIERRQKRDLHDNYFDFQLHASSGLKSFVGEIKDASDDTKSTADQITDLNELLLRNANQEKFIDANLFLAAPLPYFSIKMFQILPNLFYNVNYGASLSTNNQESPQAPTLNSFVKRDTKIGLNFKSKWRKKNLLHFSAYQLTRENKDQSLSTTGLATDGDALNFSGISEKATSINVDLDYSIITEQSKMNFLVQELKFFGDKAEDYGNNPLLNIQYTFFPKSSGFKVHPFAGIHFRNRYDIFEGLYLGAKIFNPDWAVRFLWILDTEMVTLSPSFELHWIKFHYTLKLSYRNPHNNIWVSTIHALSLTFPM